MASATEGEACSVWDNTACEGTPACPPRCPRFLDKRGEPLLFWPLDDVSVDVEALLDLYDCGAAAHSLSYPPYSTRRGLSSWLERVVEEGWNVVATDGDRLVGHAVLTPAEAEEPEFGVFVDPAYRGRGIAAELLRHCIAYGADAGYRGLVMAVERENRAMRAIATDHGFEVVAVPSDDDWIGFVSYRLALSDLPPIEPVGPLTALRDP